MEHRFPGQRSLQQLINGKTSSSLAYRLTVVILVTLVISMVYSRHFELPDATSNGEGEMTLAMLAGDGSHNERSGLDQDGIDMNQRQFSAAERVVKRNDGGLVSLEDVTKPKLLLVVSSAPRSGSSFLGDLLSSQRGAMYLYEPLWYLSRLPGRNVPKDHVDLEMRKLTTDTLYKLLHCRMSELPDMFNASLGLTIWKKPPMKVPLTTQQRTSICNDLKLRVAKVIRVKLFDVLPLLETPEQDIYIVNLVRDPRGIVNSAGGFDHWNRVLTPTKVCHLLRNDIEASLDHTDHPRFLRVRYEDVVAHPEEESRKMFNWMGLETSPDVRFFIDQHTRQTIKPRGVSATATGYSSNGTSSAAQPDDMPENAKNGSTSTSSDSTSAERRNQTVSRTIPPAQFKDRFGTFRDASFDGLHWLKDLNATRRKEAEFVCRDVLKYLKYPLVYPQEKQLENGTSTPARGV